MGIHSTGTGFRMGSIVFRGTTILSSHVSQINVNVERSIGTGIFVYGMALHFITTAEEGFGCNKIWGGIL